MRNIYQRPYFFMECFDWEVGDEVFWMIRDRIVEAVAVVVISGEIMGLSR